VLVIRTILRNGAEAASAAVGLSIGALALAAALIAASAVPAFADFAWEDSSVDPTTGAITTTVMTTVDMTIITTTDPTKGTTTTSDPTTGITTTTTTDKKTGVITTTVINPTTDTTTTTTINNKGTAGTTTTTTTNPNTGYFTTASTDTGKGSTTTTTTNPTTGVITTTITDKVNLTTTTVAVDPITGATATKTVDTKTGATTITQTTSPDPLHGYCSSGCIDNGTNSPTSQTAITGFGFSISPVGPKSGDLRIEILVASNVAQPTAADLKITGTGTAVTGNNTGSATAIKKPGAWTSGTLANYLGYRATPNNPIGAYLPSTQKYDPTATGFYVYEADLGYSTLSGPNYTYPNVSPLLNIGALPVGSYILGFLDVGTGGKHNWIATANSGAIFRSVPEPASLVLLSASLVGFGLAYRRRNRRGSDPGQLNS
jgi:hypothetical protein